ncbi:hypothetical protein QF050_000427 [Arthrobacter sp. SLBN-112]|jgi:hypothetical protein|nr:hypothetical protein [Arthrobacter sp. SLBN-112]
MDLNINKKEIGPKISPARVHDDVANLPGVIEIVGTEYPKSPLMELMRRKRTATSGTDAQLKPPHR